METEAIDLFCGIGGLTYGIQQAGIKVIAGIDNDTKAKEGYENSNKTSFITADISNYDFNKLNKLFSPNSTRILLGCAPCQIFSAYNRKIKNKANHEGYYLIDHLFNAIYITNPDIIFMENVKDITKSNVFTKFITKLKKLNYYLNFDIVNFATYGVPQIRKRLILLASKINTISLPIPLSLNKFNYKTTADTIKKLPHIKAGETHKVHKLHKSMKMLPNNIARIKQSKPGQTWKNWCKSIMPNSRINAVNNLATSQLKYYYPSIYGRMEWNKPAPTITTGFFNYGSGRYGHPEQNRALSLLEGSLLQTFPMDYNFGNKITFSNTGKHIGNAVPPLFAKIIGKRIIDHLNQQN